MFKIWWISIKSESKSKCTGDSSPTGDDSIIENSSINENRFYSSLNAHGSPAFWFLGDKLVITDCAFITNNNTTTLSTANSIFIFQRSESKINLLKKSFCKINELMICLILYIFWKHSSLLGHCSFSALAEYFECIWRIDSPCIDAQRGEYNDLLDFPKAFLGAYGGSRDI